MTWRAKASRKAEAHAVCSFVIASGEAARQSRADLTALERRTITDHRWCTAEDIRALDAAGEAVYPYHLDELLAEAVSAAEDDTQHVVRSIR